MFDWFDFKNQQFVNKDFDTIFSIRSSQLIVRILPADISCWLSLMSFRRYYLFFAAGYALSNIFKGDNIENNKVWIVSSILYILGTLYYVQYVKSVDGIIDLVIWILTNFVGCHFWLCLCRRSLVSR